MKALKSAQPNKFVAFSRISSLLWLIITIFILSGCSTPYPLNMTEEQWSKLSEAQRTQLLLKEQKIRAERAKTQQLADNQARQLELQAQIEESKRLQQLYANPANGRVIRINILGGQWIESKKTYRIASESFRIALGESKEFEILLKDKKGRSHYRDIYAEYRTDGDAVYLRLHPYDQNRIALLNRDNWKFRNQYQKQLNDAYRKINLRISVHQIGYRRP